MHPVSEKNKVVTQPVRGDIPVRFSIYLYSYNFSILISLYSCLYMLVNIPIHKQFPITLYHSLLLLFFDLANQSTWWVASYFFSESRESDDISLWIEWFLLRCIILLAWLLLDIETDVNIRVPLEVNGLVWIHITSIMIFWPFGKLCITFTAAIFT